MAGMRPLGFIFKNQLFGELTLFVYPPSDRAERRVAIAAYSSFWILVEMFIGSSLYCRPSSSRVMDALMPLGVGQLYRVSGAMVEYWAVGTDNDSAASLEAARGL